MSPKIAAVFHLYVSLLLSVSIISVLSQPCLQEAGGADPPFTDDNSNPVIPSGTPEGVEAIIPTYTFNCCANVTEWSTIVQPGGGGHSNGVYSVGFLVYRPIGTANRCYSEVGKNNFPSVTVSNGFITEPVQPSDYITVQPGDVAGITIASTNGGNEGIQLDETLNNNRVYYTATDSLAALIPGSCPTTDGGTYTRVTAAPMLRVSLEVFPCQSSTISTLSSSTQVEGSTTESTILERPLTTSPSNTLVSHAITTAATGNISLSTSVSTTTTTTTVSNTFVMPEGNGSIIVGVAAGVAILLVAIVSSVVALVIGILVRRKSSKIREKEDEPLELSNPNYIYDSVSREKLTDSGAIGTNYHDIGPHPQDAATNAISSPVYQESDNIGDNIVRVYDVPHFDGVYEDPTLPSFRRQDTGRNMGLFEEVGYYVPTLEERSEKGLELYSSPSASNYSKRQFFEEDQVYWVPANTATDLYCQLASKKYKEIPRNQIKLHSPLGSGQFGEVYKATWSIGKQKMELAVKTLKSGASEEGQVKFLQEAAIMGQFSHNNVIKMYGVVTLGEPVLLCAEMLENGDLRNYLIKSALKVSNKKDIQLTFLKFARDIAAGMNYLSKKCFIHRDLAARNILVNKNLTCKVADFGMARDLMDDTYYTSSGGKIPVKWTAPEAILYKKYSTDSDVWSYGMVLFEIWSVGKKPFSNLTNTQVLRLLQTGYCQPPPPGCPRAVFQLMVDCWNPDHQSRPKFSDISQSYLQQPSSSLLHWSPEDNHISPQVGVCGSPLHEAERLYIDLQQKYESYREV